MRKGQRQPGDLGSNPNESLGARLNNPEDLAEEAVLDVFLADAFGNEQVPDLTGRILQALAMQSGDAGQQSQQVHPHSTTHGLHESAEVEESPGRARAGLSAISGLPTPPVPVQERQLSTGPAASANGQAANGQSPIANQPILLGSPPIPDAPLADSVSESLVESRRGSQKSQGTFRTPLWMAAIAASLLALVIAKPWEWNWPSWGTLNRTGGTSVAGGSGSGSTSGHVDPQRGLANNNSTDQSKSGGQGEIEDQPGSKKPPVVPDNVAQQDPVTPNSDDTSEGVAKSPIPPIFGASDGHKSPENALGSQTIPELTPEILRHSAGSQDVVPSSSPDFDDAVVAAINALIRKRWEEDGVRPAPPATDAEWCRRVYLDLLGRIPTVDEALAYQADRGKDKKRRLVDRLLGEGYALTGLESTDYQEQFARNWTSIWMNVLLGRTGGKNNPAVDRAGFEQYLYASLESNKPYDQLVKELLTATGSNRPGTEHFNGAVNFLLDNLSQKAQPATTKTSEIFLGLQLQCTQCHQHPANSWKQHHFWELNAFFRQAYPRTKRVNGAVVTELVDADFAGDGPKPDLDSAEIYFEHHSGMMKVAYPTFVNGAKIDPSGRVTEINRRQKLAEMVTQSEYLPRAAVNRMWAHFLGYGFTAPITDMGPHNFPSHPELLSYLSENFAKQGFDLKQLMRWITLSEAYELSSRVPRNTIDDPHTGPPLFSYFYIRQMRAEELFDSLQVATRGALPQGEKELAALAKHKQRWLEQFAEAYETDENNEANLFDGGLNQSVMMWNGELINEAVSGSKGTFLHQVATSKLSDVEKIHQLFVAALGRAATTSELRLVQQAARQHRGDSMAALQDLWWTLLNQSEFILNH